MKFSVFPLAGDAGLLDVIQAESEISRFGCSRADFRTIRMEPQLEWSGVAVHWNRSCSERCSVRSEDSAAYLGDTKGWRSGWTSLLDSAIHLVASAWNLQPIKSAGSFYCCQSSGGARGGARNGKGSGWTVEVVCTSCVTDTTETLIDADAHGVILIGQLLERSDRIRNTSEVEG